MEESKHFQSEMKYELPTYREFQKLNIQAHLRNTIMYFSVALCLFFLIFMLSLSVFWMAPRLRFPKPERFYMCPEKGSVERLCSELGLESSSVYRKRDKALRRFTVALYGSTGD